MAAFAYEPLPDDQLQAALAERSMDVVGRFPSSNLTLLVELVGEEPDSSLFAVYKPEAGERPLWDFEPGLYRRERAAFVLSEWLGWGLVPATVVRQDAPLGPGSVQAYIDADDRTHFFTLDQRQPGVAEVLRRMALFDVLANNADRKSGHVLRGPDGRIWGIDHGLCFAVQDKLRTVIWDFGGEPVPDCLLEDLQPLRDEAPSELDELLSAAEVAELRARAGWILERPRFPVDRSGRRVPWPMV